MKKIIAQGIMLTALVSLNSAYGATKKTDTPKQTPKKTNVLFLFIDDMTYNGLNILGNHEIISPTLDSLIGQGTRFVNTYNMGGWNGAVSIASRTQMLTGLYLWNADKAQDTKFDGILNANKTWGQVMVENGYDSYHTGKWHMKGVKPTEAFQQSDDPRPGMPNQTPEGYNRPLSKNDNKWLPWDKSKEGYWKGGEHWTEVLVDDASKYLDEHRNSSKPVFMFCCFNAVHDPHQSPKKFVDMYDVNKIKLPKSFLPLYPFKDEMGCGKSLRDERLAPFPRTKYSIQKNRQEYYALITHLDSQIKRLLNKLKEDGMADNTFIIVAADNGLSIGRHGLMGKQSMYDEAMKIPLAFIGKGIPKGEIRTQLVYLQDLVPTVMDMVNVKYPSQMQFKSQINIINNATAKPVREYIYGAYEDLQRMVRGPRYKLFFITKSKRLLIYDLHNDPLEMHDIYIEMKDTPIVHKLGEEYLKLAKEAGDTLNIKPLFPQVFK